MRVRKLDTSKRRDVRAFIRFPFRLYCDCPQWVPPLLPDMRLALNRRRYPFYRQSDADFFLAESKGQTVGRIAVLENRPYNEYHNSKAAFFYYMETVEDVQVSRALFDAAFDWARKRGLDTIYGPKGFLRGDAHGALVEGFEHRPAFGVPYNYAYYDACIRDSGFEKELDYFSGYASADRELPQRFIDIAERVKVRRGFQVRSFTHKDELLALAPAIHRIYQQAFVQVWGYYPVSEKEISALIERIATIADPRLIKLVVKAVAGANQNEEAIGFVIAYPDVSAAIQKISGRVWPLGWACILLETQRTKWVNFNGVGIVPKYQGIGANAVLYQELVKTLKSNAFHFEHGEFVQVAENNVHSLGDANAIGISWYKPHRMYRRTLY
jgi:GNAT superfamily N-acetyltransferase